jgi:hypothetical protein
VTSASGWNVGVERAQPGRHLVDLAAADLVGEVGELTGEVAQLDRVVVEQGQAADPEAGQALQHA